MPAELETGYHQLHTFKAPAPDSLLSSLHTEDKHRDNAIIASSPEAAFSSHDSPDYIYSSFSGSMRRRVKREQNNICAYCGTSCRGHDMNESILAIHHIVPGKLGGTNTRDNAVGLCADNCHPYFDRLAFEEGKTFIDVLMDEGIKYDPYFGNSITSEEIQIFSAAD
jgi:predicted restriction endonuclease